MFDIFLHFLRSFALGPFLLIKLVDTTHPPFTAIFFRDPPPENTPTY